MNKPKTTVVAALAFASLCLASTAEAQQQQPAQQAAPQLPQVPNMTFFVTSVGPGKGADLGGLEGADQYCQQLAQRHGAGGKTWRAYLSTQAADGRGRGIHRIPRAAPTAAVAKPTCGAPAVTGCSIASLPSKA
jgi:hypothetical protein